VGRWWGEGGGEREAEGGGARKFTPRHTNKKKQIMPCCEDTQGPGGYARSRHMPTKKQLTEQETHRTSPLYMRHNLRKVGDREEVWVGWGRRV